MTKSMHLPAFPETARPSPSSTATGVRALAGFTLTELLIVVAMIAVLLVLLTPILWAAQRRTYDTGAQACGKSLQTVQAIAQVDQKSFLLIGSGTARLNTNSDGVNAACRNENILVKERSDPATIVSTYTIDVWDRRGSKTFTVEPESFDSRGTDLTPFPGGGGTLP